MTTKYDFTAKTIGVSEDRTREQYTAQLLYHPTGEPGHVYVAQVLAHIRADSLEGLAAHIAAFADLEKLGRLS